MAITIDPRRRRLALRVLAVLVVINVAVFVALRLLAAFSPDAVADIISALALPGGDSFPSTHPWSLVSYMFTQYDELHIILNMLWLCWFWLLLADAGISAGKLLATYLAGGIAAACAYTLLAPSGMLIGSSGAVMAVVTATAVAIPRTRVDLPLLRPVNIATAAGIIIAISLVCMAYGSAGSYAAHLAGALAGALAGIAMRRSRKPHTSADGKQYDTLDEALIDKLRSSGFSSLSPAERSALVDNSRKQ